LSKSDFYTGLGLDETWSGDLKKIGWVLSEKLIPNPHKKDKGVAESDLCAEFRCVVDGKELSKGHTPNVVAYTRDELIEAVTNRRIVLIGVSEKLRQAALEMFHARDEKLREEISQGNDGQPRQMAAAEFKM